MRQSIELTGPFSGYNNEPTMQVGLWITNDANNIGAARQAVANGGAHGLYLHLSGVIRTGVSAGARDMRYVLSRRDIEETIDWAQVALALVDGLEGPTFEEAARKLRQQAAAERESDVNDITTR